LHEFLGEEYGAKSLAIVGAICTTLGFLGMFAVELTVGSRFISGLIQKYPQWAVVMALSTVAFVYTSLGGFRAVIVTDRIQMGAIWILLLALVAFVGSYFFEQGFTESIALIPESVKSFTWREGLGSFLWGILVINMLSYMADMSIWQRIGASEEPATVMKGLGRSVLNSLITWTVLVALACLAWVVVKPVAGENPLLTILATAGLKAGIWGKIVLFCVVLGLFGAMLSTASTQLIAVSHTVYEDLLGRLRRLSLADRVSSGRELLISRVILIYAALLAMILVEWLAYLGFSVADMVFAVYGAQLALLPPIALALWLPRERLRPMAKWANWAIALGFTGGWTAEIIGKLTESHLAFLSPIVSISVSILIMALAWGKSNR
jgi:Na+/proline symporter